MSIEAMKRARKAMASFQSGTGGLYEGEFDEEIAGLDKAIAEAEQAQPVAWMGTDPEGNPNKFRLNEFGAGIPLYTAPPPRNPWVGLTDEDVKTIWAFSWTGDRAAFIRAIEAKLKEKNT